MGFLNAWLLLGCLAFAVPLIIHLLNRSKFQTVEWGAMHLLENIELQNAKRIQWQAILLLLLRCLVPIILAICMARPIWNWWTGSASGSASATMLVVDDSYSMQATTESVGSQADTANAKKSSWEKAIEVGSELATGVGAKSAKSVIAMGGTPRNLTEGTSYDLRPIARQLERLTPSSLAVKPVPALQMALDTLAKTQEPYRQVVVVSDFQKQDWLNIPEETLTSIREQIKGSTVPVHLHFFPIVSRQESNLYIAFDATSSEITTAGEPVELRGVVFNAGSEKANAVEVKLRIDEADVAYKKLDIAANSSAQVSFIVTLDSPGSHQAILQVNDSSPIQGDNEDRLAIEVLPVQKILLVEPNPARPLLETETGFLQLALQSTIRDDEKTTGIELVRSPSDRLNTTLIENADMIVLANVPKLPDPLVESLAKRVEQGAILSIYGGEQTDRNWYAERLGDQAKTKLLPYRYEEPTAVLESQKNGDSGKPLTLFTFASAPYADPALQLFNSPQQGRLDQVAIKRWHRLSPWKVEPAASPNVNADGKLISVTVNNQSEQANDADSVETVISKPSVVLGLKTGEPMLVSKKYGKGTVYQWAIPCNDAWSDLPVRPAYVPLMQRLLLFARASATPHTTLNSRTESQHNPLPENELQALADKLGATIEKSPQTFLQRESDRRDGREIWRWLLVGLIAILFGELFLEKRLTRGGR